MRAFLRDRAGLVVFTAALVVQAVGLAQFWQESPFAHHLVLDAFRYDAEARAIAGGAFPVASVFHQAPLYPHLVALVYALTGGSTLALFALQGALGALCALLVYRLGRVHFGRPTGVAAGLMAVFCQPLIAFAPRVLPAVPILFLELLFLDRLPEDGETRAAPWIVPGTIAGLLALARPTHLLLALIAVAASVFTRRPHRRGLLAFLAPMLLLVAPMTIHNAARGGGFVLVSSNGGETFYHGNNPGAAGGYALMAGLESADILKQQEVSKAIAEARSGRTLNAAGVSRYWLGQGLAFIREDPGRFLWLELQKLRLVAGGGESPDIYSPAFEASVYTPLYRVGIFRLPLILPFALAGLVIIGSRLPRWILAMMALNVLTMLAFYVSNRYRLSLEVLLLIPAAVALLRVRERRTQLWLLPGLLLMLTLLATQDADRARAARGKVLVNLGASLGKEGDYAGAESVFRSAIAQDPSWARAHHYLGRALANQSKNAAAIAAYEQAARLAPDEIAPRVDLVHAYGRAQRPEEASRHLTVADSLATARGDAAALARIARVWLALGRPAESVRALESSLALDPRDAGSWEALVRLLAREGACEEARARLDDALVQSGAPPGFFVGLQGELEQTCPQ